jgi:hypothetical protein
MHEAAEKIGLDAIDRILDAIGRKYIPSHLDRSQFAIGLMQCLHTYHAAVERNSDRPTKDKERWPRLSEQIFRVDKWSLCRG